MQGQTVGSGYVDTRNQVNKLAVPSANPSCFGQIEDACSSAVRTASRVEALVDRLCGTVPSPAETGDPRSGSSSLFDAAEAHARDIRNSAERINAALDRLEKHLP